MQLLLLCLLSFSYNHRERANWQTAGEFSPRTERAKLFVNWNPAALAFFLNSRWNRCEAVGIFACKFRWDVGEAKWSIASRRVVWYKKFPKAFTSYSRCAFITLMHGYRASFFNVSQVLMRLATSNLALFPVSWEMAHAQDVTQKCWAIGKRVEHGYKFLHACQSNLAKKMTTNLFMYTAEIGDLTIFCYNTLCVLEVSML
jgi:hypothetical protein